MKGKELKQACITEEEFGLATELLLFSGCFLRMVSEKTGPEASLFPIHTSSLNRNSHLISRDHFSYWSLKRLSHPCQSRAACS